MPFDFYRPQGKVIFSQACVILSAIGLMESRSLTAQSVRILLECFLVFAVIEPGIVLYDGNADNIPDIDDSIHVTFTFNGECLVTLSVKVHLYQSESDVASDGFIDNPIYCLH